MKPLDFACPLSNCGAQAGQPCKTRTVRKEAEFFHSMRLRKARAEEAGPQEGDVYYDDRKFRVTRVIEGCVGLRRGGTKEVAAIDRRLLEYDAVVGMWRRKAIAAGVASTEAI